MSCSKAGAARPASVTVVWQLAQRPATDPSLWQLPCPALTVRLRWPPCGRRRRNLQPFPAKTTENTRVFVGNEAKGWLLVPETQQQRCRQHRGW
jgi:hypothetical protein